MSARLGDVQTFLSEARSSLQNLMMAVDSPEDADPTIADQCREDVQKCMKYLSLAGINATVKVELNELSDQIAELLDMWDAHFSNKNEENEREEQIRRDEEERRRREEEEAERQRKIEKEKEETRKKMEEIRRKKKEEAEMKLLQEQLANMKKQREAQEKKQLEMDALNRQSVELGIEIQRLRNLVDSYKNGDTIDSLKKELIDEQQRWMNQSAAPAESGNTEENYDEIYEKANKERDRQIDKLKRQYDQKIAEDIDHAKKDIDSEYEKAIAAFQEEWLAKAVVKPLTDEERAAIEKKVAKEFTDKVADMEKAIWKAENNPDKPIPEDECLIEIDRLKRLYEKECTERKKLYNELVDMKGSIRVYVRVRWMDPKMALVRGGDISVDFTGDDTIFVKETPDADIKKCKSYVFDRVFRMPSTQEEVFADTLPLITSVIDGYNVCIFAYGQTGSGKTWTMNGTTDKPGVMRKCVNELFKMIQERSATEECEVKGGVLEIYNDEVADLMVSKTKQHPKGYAIKLDPVQGVVVDNLIFVPLTKPTDIEHLIQTSDHNRTAEATQMNANSSRSHLVMYIVIYIYNKQTHSKIVSKICLVDLAGSERIAKSGVEGKGLKEAQHINKSLSALGDVISSLKMKGKHTPYRNSTLTFLLQDSLGGKAKTLMFANVSPMSGDYSETISTLEFANRTRGITLGKAKKNVSAA